MSGAHEFAKMIAHLAGDSSVATCQQCGACSAACPQIGCRQTVRQVIQAVNSGLRSLALAADIVQACSVCGRCSEVCPEALEVAEIVYSLRRLSLGGGADQRAVLRDCFGQLAVLLETAAGGNGLAALLQQAPLALLAFGPLALSLVRGEKVQISPPKQVVLEEVRQIYHACLEMSEP